MLSPLFLLGILVGCRSESTSGRSSPEPCVVEASGIDLPPSLLESSGVIFGRADPAVLWSHNDSGGEAELFALDRQGNLIGRPQVTGATNTDWEDLALGPCPEGGDCIYVGDIGDNLARRSEIAVYVFPEPAPSDAATVAATRYSMRYPDGPRDAEALFVTESGEIYIISKGGEAPITLFRYPPPLRPDEGVVLERIRTLSEGTVPLGQLVTGADVSANGDWIVVRSYTEVTAYPAATLLDHSDPRPERTMLSTVADGQGEGVAAGDGGLVALTSEAFGEALPGSLTILSCPELERSPPLPGG